MVLQTPRAVKFNKAIRIYLSTLPSNDNGGQNQFNVKDTFTTYRKCIKNSVK